LSVGDAHSLVAALVATHGAQLRRFLLARLRNAADMPDILQEVYLRMLRVPAAESIRSPEAYLFTVAQHVIQQHALKQSAIPPFVELSRLLNSPPAAPELDPALDLDALQCIDRLQGALDRLSPKARATFLLHRRDGLSFDEIGGCLGISRAMAKKYLAQALMQLRRRVEDSEQQ
jgi:RNA polymerase sigma factor (sigma-70 family)